MTGNVRVPKAFGQPGYRFWWSRVVSDDAELPAAAKNFARVLCLYLNDHGRVYRPQEELVADMGVATRTLQDAAAALEAGGYVTRCLGYSGHTTEYTCVLPDELPPRTKGAMSRTQTDDGTEARVRSAAPNTPERVRNTTERVRSAAPHTNSEPTTGEPTTGADPKHDDDTTPAKPKKTGKQKRSPATQQHRDIADGWLGDTISILHPIAKAKWDIDMKHLADKDNAEKKPGATRAQLIGAIAQVSKTNNPDAFSQLRRRVLVDNDETNWERVLEGRVLVGGVATRGNIAKIMLKRLYDGVDEILAEPNWQLADPDTIPEATKANFANLLSGLKAANSERLAT